MDAYTVDLEAMGKRIKELRLSQKKTQAIFAEMIHISTSYLALLEQGKRTASLDIVAQISKNCHVSADYLLFGSPLEPSTINEKYFHVLCQQYEEHQVERALRLASYYLNMENQPKK